MKVKICWTKNGVTDWTVLMADTLEQLQDKANAEIERRKPLDHWWSEEYVEKKYEKVF